MFRRMSARPADCLSDLSLDAWLARDLDEDGACSVSTHLALCSRCRGREAELSRHRAEFRRVHAEPPAWLVAAALPQQHAKTRRAAWWTAAIAAAAAATLALLPRADESVRTKGTDHLSFYVKRDENVRRGKPRERVHAGDQLRFTYSASSARYLAILSLDGAKRASVYFPEAEYAARVEPGTDVLLPSAIELDDVLGEERIVALFCTRALALAQLRAELQRRQTVTAPEGCSMDEIVLLKEVRTP